MYNVCFDDPNITMFLQDTDRMYLCLSQEKIIQFQVKNEDLSDANFKYFDGESDPEKTAISLYLPLFHT